MANHLLKKEQDKPLKKHKGIDSTEQDLKILLRRLEKL